MVAPKNINVQTIELFDGVVHVPLWRKLQGRNDIRMEFVQVHSSNRRDPAGRPARLGHGPDQAGARAPGRERAHVFELNPVFFSNIPCMTTNRYLRQIQNGVRIATLASSDAAGHPAALPVLHLPDRVHGRHDHVSRSRYRM